jgi:hypothetical protein
MKKLFIITLSAALCLALAMPAMAKTSVYGRVTFDTYYRSLSAEAQIPGGLSAGTPLPVGSDDLSTVKFNMPAAWNRIGLKWANDDNTVRALMEIRGGGQGGGSVGGGDVFLNYAWIDWQLSPNFYLRLGRQTQAFAIMYPHTIMGHVDGHTLGAGFGNVHGGSSRDAARAYWKFSDMVRVEIQLLDPDSDSPGEITLPNAAAVAATTAITATASEENTLPRLDVAVPITFGNWVVEPSFTYATSNYDQVQAGSDDDYDSWGLACGIKAGFGMFSFQGEITFGQNLSGSGYAGGSAFAAPVAYSPLATSSAKKIEDTDILAWWAQIGVKFGPGTLYGMYGQEKTENDGNPSVVADALERDVTRKFYGVTMPIAVAKGFTIRPEIIFYDNDSSANIGGTGVDFGDELIAGVEFMLTF